MPVVRVIEQAERGGGELDDSDTVSGADVDVDVKAEPIGIEAFGPIDVVDGYRNKFEQERAGRPGRRLGGDISRVGRDLGLRRRRLWGLRLVMGFLSSRL
jgi:hypothetical protein